MTQNDAKPSPEAKADLSMAFRADWGKVDLVRTSLAGFTQATTLSASAAQLLSSVAAELLENAVKFASDGSDKPPMIKFRVSIRALQVSVFVTNPFELGGTAYARFEHTWNELESGAQPAEVYRQRLAAIHEGAERGLGLARLHDLGCALDRGVDGSELTVIARFSLDEHPLSGGEDDGPPARPTVS